MQQFTIEQARKYAGLSQAEIAKELDISLNAYISKEKGITKFYVDEALKFSEKVGLPFNQIIFLPEMFQKNGTH